MKTPILPRLAVVKLSLLLAISLLGFATFGHAGVVISELMASNSGFLKDEDGDSSDWIEIHNDGATTVDLTGWHLTDSPDDLLKWTFPATNLPSDGYLIVFASDKNRAVSGGELHTNFKLSADGDFLALVEADGTTVASSFSPAYPRQRDNVSYGLTRDSFVTPLISAGATARLLVPENGTLGLTWTAREFNDSTWITTNSPIGFNVGETGNLLLAIDFNERATDTAINTQPGFDSFVINSNSSASAIQTQPTTRIFGGISVTVSNSGSPGYDDRARTTPADNGEFTESLLLRDFIFSTDLSGTSGLDISIAGLMPNQPHRMTVWSFDSSSSGNRISDWSANGIAATNGYTFNGSVPPVSNEQSRFTFDATADATGKILLSGRRNPTNTSYGIFLNALKIESLATGSATNGLAALMVSNNATAYLRIPFSVADANAFSALKLRMKYNDGFVAYINGQLVASRNAPGSPQWNSTAIATHPATDYEDVFIPNPASVLSNGNNVLAIQGLNVSATNSDFSIEPELSGVEFGNYASRYFDPATPGAENGSGFLDLVDETSFSVERGFYETPFDVALSTPTSGAEIYWTTNGSVPSPTNGTLYTGPVSVAGTTLLRAAAFRSNYVASVPVTHTYLFPNDILQQPANPPGYPTTWQGSYPADYGVDSNIVNSASYGATLKDDLRSIPAISIVTDFNSLWNSSTGIYVDATKRGDAWERATSLEMFEGDNTTDFQVNCGVRMQGNAGRDNARTPKHSFRLLFKSGFGASKLDHKLFEDSPVDSFDTFLLRSAWTDSWPTRYSDTNFISGTTNRGARYRPEEALNLRDVWVKDSFRDMGNWLSPHSDFAQVFLNGLYWGLYNYSERVDSDFVSSYLGGLSGDWDVIVGGDTSGVAEVADGNLADWDSMMVAVNAGISSETEYQAIAQLVDIDNLIDYMLLHIFSEVEDWPNHNWYAAHRRANSTNGLPATKWIFIPWDQDIALDQLVRRNRINVNNNDTPARIYSQLRNWPEFRREFGDRIQKHFFNNGALTPSNNVARMMERAGRIDRAIVAESARWGDAREFATPGNIGTGQTFTRDEWWLPELQKLCTNFFPTLNDTNLARFRAGDLYPSLDAPVFSQFGGAIPQGFSLTMSHSNASGVIFFTTDGADPREYGTAAIAPNARRYSSAVTLNSATRIRARVYNTGQWSALVEADFSTPQNLNDLALTEIMYNPPAFDSIAGNDLEFLELKNVGTNTLDLSGLAFTEGITFAFTNGTTLAPGAFFVLGSKASGFNAKYPGVTLNGDYSGQLDNSGETLTLAETNGATVFSVTYSDESPWPITPDGFGFSLVPKNPGASQAPDEGTKWRASSQMGGSPGADDPEPTVPPVVITEIISHTDPPQRDVIELFNPTETNADISGWFLTDDASVSYKFRIPNGTILSPGEYTFFDEDDFNAGIGTNVNFAFSSTGEEVYLFSANANGALTGYTHGFVFGPMFNGDSFGRYVNSVGEEFFPRELSNSPGQPNAGPRVGPIVFNEINYHPEANGDAFIELLNVTSNSVNLFDANVPTNTWKVGGIGYTFPTNITMNPEELLLIVSTNPATFRAKHNVPAAVQILGPFTGALDRGGEQLTLEQPDNPNTDLVPYVVVEQLLYDDKSPWPAAADGGGSSLQRISRFVFSSEPTNWIAAPPTPGLLVEQVDTDGDGIPDSYESAHGMNPQINDGNEDLDDDGASNLIEYQNGTDPQIAQNFFRLGIELGANSNTAILDFYTLPGKNYEIEKTPSLAPANWDASFILSGATNAQLVRITNSDLSSAQFYRLKIQ